MSIVINKHTGCIERWIISKNNCINFIGSGIEYSDWISFFSQERLYGLKMKFKKIHQYFNSNYSECLWKIESRISRLLLNLTIEEKSPKVLRQKLEISALGETYSWIGDAVVRFVLPKIKDSYAIVEDKKIEHKGSNVMYETEEREITLMYGNIKLIFSWEDGYPQKPFGVTPYLYVRDEPYNLNSVKEDSWVLHGRVLTEVPSLFVFRIAKSPFVLWNKSKLMSNIFERLNLYKYWRAWELKVSKHFQTQGIMPILPGIKIVLSVELKAE